MRTNGVKNSYKSSRTTTTSNMYWVPTVPHIVYSKVLYICKSWYPHCLFYILRNEVTDHLNNSSRSHSKEWQCWGSNPLIWLESPPNIGQFQYLYHIQIIHQKCTQKIQASVHTYKTCPVLFYTFVIIGFCPCSIQLSKQKKNNNISNILT